MQVAVLGLGLIGSVWARHWHADGHAVRAWNRTPKPEQPGWTADPLAADHPTMVSITTIPGADHQNILNYVVGAIQP